MHWRRRQGTCAGGGKYFKDPLGAVAARGAAAQEQLPVSVPKRELTRRADFGIRPLTEQVGQNPHYEPVALGCVRNLRSTSVRDSAPLKVSNHILVCRPRKSVY